MPFALPCSTCICFELTALYTPPHRLAGTAEPVHGLDISTYPSGVFSTTSTQCLGHTDAPRRARRELFASNEATLTQRCSVDGAGPRLWAALVDAEQLAFRDADPLVRTWDLPMRRRLPTRLLVNDKPVAVVVLDD